MLGLLGALDPYKHKVNIGMIDQSRDASALSLSESKTNQDSGEERPKSINLNKAATVFVWLELRNLLHFVIFVLVY